MEYGNRVWQVASPSSYGYPDTASATCDDLAHWPVSVVRVVA